MTEAEKIFNQMISSGMSKFEAEAEIYIWRESSDVIRRHCENCCLEQNLRTGIRCKSHEENNIWPTRSIVDIKIYAEPIGLFASESWIFN